MTKQSDPTAIDGMFSDGHRLIGVAVHGDTQFDMPLVTQVKDNLYQGGACPGLALDERFQHLICLYPWGRYKVQWQIETELYVTMYDSKTDAHPQLDALANLVNLCRADAPTLVHCQAGLNRSSLVVSRALFLGGDFDNGDDIVEFVRQQRSPACLCNPVFEAEVRSWRR